MHDPMAVEVLEDARATPALLDIKSTRRLPQVVFEGEEDDLCAARRLDARERRRLLRDTGHRGAVGLAGMRPTRLDDVGRLARADGLEDGELRLDEGAGLAGGGVGVEEGVDVGGDDVDGAAQRRAFLLPDVQRLRRRDGARVAGAGEGPLAASNQAREVANGEVVVEEGFVADDDHLDQVPLAPGNDLRDLGLGARDA